MIVGSLFSKRPRVTGSNCRTSCLAGVTDFSAGAFSSFHGTDFSCYSSRARARRYESVSLAVRWRWVVPLQPRQVLRMEPFPREVELRQSVLQVEFQVPVLRLRIVLELADTADALLGAGGVCSKTASSSAESELMIVTLNRSPSRASTAAPKRICVWSLT